MEVSSHRRSHQTQLWDWPEDQLIYIAEYMTTRKVCALMRTCTYFYHVFERSNDFWKKKLANQLPLRVSESDIREAFGSGPVPCYYKIYTQINRFGKKALVRSQCLSGAFAKMTINPTGSSMAITTTFGSVQLAKKRESNRWEMVGRPLKCLSVDSSEKLCVTTLAIFKGKTDAGKWGNGSSFEGLGTIVQATIDASGTYFATLSMEGDLVIWEPAKEVNRWAPTQVAAGVGHCSLALKKSHLVVIKSNFSGGCLFGKDRKGRWGKIFEKNQLISSLDIASSKPFFAYATKGECVVEEQTRMCWQSCVLPNSESIQTIAIDPTDTFILGAGSNLAFALESASKLVIWQKAKGGWRQTVQTAHLGGSEVSWDPQRRFFAVASVGGLEIWNYNLSLFFFPKGKFSCLTAERLKDIVSFLSPKDGSSWCVNHSMRSFWVSLKKQVKRKQVS